MPEQQMLAFRSLATEAEIDRVVERIDIRHASSTLPRDRAFVLGEVESSIGADTLNVFCREIVRHALLEAAQIPPRPGSTDAVDTVLDKLEERADSIAVERSVSRDACRTPMEIEMRRAVALMKLRRDGFTAAVRDQLEGVVRLARRYYGDRAQIVRDVKVFLET